METQKERKRIIFTRSSSKREDFDVAPRALQNCNAIKKVTVVNSSDPAISRSNDSNGNVSSLQETSGKGTHTIEVPPEDHNVAKNKYTKNKNAKKARSLDPDSIPSPRRSPRFQEHQKREKSTSPRLSGGGSKQHAVNSQMKTSEKNSASSNNLEVEPKPKSRKSYGGELKTNLEAGKKSRWSAGMVNNNIDINVKKSKTSKEDQNSTSLLNKDNNDTKSNKSSSLEVTDTGEARRKIKGILKSPRKVQKSQVNQKKEVSKMNSFEREGNKSPRSLLTKEQSTIEDKKSKKDGGASKNNKTSIKNSPPSKEFAGVRVNGNGLENTSHSELQVNKDIDVITAMDHDENIERCDIYQRSSVDQDGGSGINNVTKLLNEDKNNSTVNDLAEKSQSQRGSYDHTENSCKHERDVQTNGEILTDYSIEFKSSSDSSALNVEDKEDVIIQRVINCPFVTKRNDMDEAPDTLKPMVDFENTKENSDQNSQSTCSSHKNDTNDNNVITTQYEAIAGTSKKKDVNNAQQKPLHIGQQVGLSSVVQKLARKVAPARSPIILKTPKRMKDGETMSEMLIYKLGSHTTPRKIRKNRNLDYLQKSDWGTPATNCISSGLSKRSITKKIKSKIFIKKTSRGMIHPIATSKFVPKNSPKREKPKKSVQTIGNDEIYKVTPVSALIKKFENMKCERESQQDKKKVMITFRKNSDLNFDKWTNATTENVQKILELKQIKQEVSDAEIQDSTVLEKANEISTSNSNTSDQNGNPPSLLFLNVMKTEPADVSFLEEKFDEMFSDQCDQTVDQAGKNMRFSDLFKEIDFKQCDSGNDKEDKEEKSGNSIEKNSEKESNGESETKNISEENKTSLDNNFELEINDNRPAGISDEKEGPEMKKENISEKSDKEHSIDVEICQNEVDILFESSPENISTCEKKLAISGKLDEEKYSAEEEDNSTDPEKDLESQGSVIKASSNSTENGDIFNEQGDNYSTENMEIVERELARMTINETVISNPLEKSEDEENSKDDSNSNDIETINCHDLINFKVETSRQDDNYKKTCQFYGDSNEDFHGFEDVVISTGKEDTRLDCDMASPASEVGIDIKEEEFGDSYKEVLLNSTTEEEDEESISTLLALSRELSKQPTSYADYRKQFMEVKSRSLPPQKPSKCDSDAKMSL